MEIAAVVPSLNPDEKLLRVVKDLSGAGIRVFLVDDGSGSGYERFFEEAAEYPGCELLRHEVNCGKGRALKTAFEVFLARCPDYGGVVTVDADGQHRLDDILACARMLGENPDALVLGCRDFSGPEVPFRSALGNRFTRGVFRMFCGLKITDTQTGLRGIPYEFCRALPGVEGERYEFETNMLLEAKKRRVPIREVIISTTYIDENESSHFNPLRDSLRIYGLIFKFVSVSLLSFCLDIALFTLLYRLLGGMPESGRIFAATAVARAASSLFNFFANRSAVFNGKAKVRSALPRYYALCGIQMLASWAGVWTLSALARLPATPVKLAVDALLMLASFHIQRVWVFKEYNTNLE